MPLLYCITRKEKTGEGLGKGGTRSVMASKYFSLLAMVLSSVTVVHNPNIVLVHYVRLYDETFLGRLPLEHGSPKLVVATSSETCTCDTCIRDLSKAYF
jgi:hypothetical protein